MKTPSRLVQVQTSSVFASLYQIGLHAKLARYRMPRMPVSQPFRRSTMPRMPSIRYFKSRKAFYCQYQGQQYPLAKGPDDRPDGPTFLKAVEEFGRVMEEGRAVSS